MKIKEAINWAKNELNEVSSSRLDAELLLSHVLNSTRESLVINSEEEVEDKIFNTYKNLIKRRLLREPIAYIIGNKEFWGLDFKVTSDVLVPRPETEHIIELVLEKYLFKSKADILELGTGSGCIAISLATELERKNINFDLTASDISEKALLIAKENSKFNNVDQKISFIQSDWFDKINGKYDLIISNPPYVNKKLDSLSPELSYEPQNALYSENKGLNDVFYLINNIHNYLKKNGVFLCEIGSEQREDILNYYLELGLSQDKINFYNDLSGKVRILEIKQ